MDEAAVHEHVIRERRAGKTCMEIARELRRPFRKIVGIWTIYCRTSRMLDQPAQPRPLSDSATRQLLAEWKQNVRAVIDGKMP